MKNICVYQHIRLDTNEIFYIGIGKLTRAFDKHKNRRSKHWFRIVNKHNYKVEILYENLTWKEACNIEINLIKQYGRLDLGTGLLINHTDGGEGTRGIIQSKEHKLKRSQALKGKKFTNEHKAKLSEVKKGKILTEEHKDNIRKSMIKRYQDKYEI